MCTSLDSTPWPTEQARCATCDRPVSSSGRSCLYCAHRTDDRVFPPGQP
jgi:hypothetical protein